MRFSILLAALVAFGCGDDDSTDAGTDSSTADVPTADAPMTDSANDDSGADDAGEDDAGEDDAGADDAGANDGGDDAGADDAGADDAGGDTSLPFDADGACHALGFGRGVVTLENVDSLPEMTGGTITLGAWDLVAVQTTGALSGTSQGTWTFETDSTLQTLSWLALSGEPPAPTPRTESYSTEGSNLIRNQTCGGSDSFNTGYRVRTDAGETLLDVRSGTVMFTYQLR